MKKKAVTIDKQKKKERKKAQKIKKECATALDWSNIEMIDDNAIYLKHGAKQEKTIGLRISPRNIFIDTNHVQIRVINNLRCAFNKLRFPIYWGFVFVPVAIDDHIAMLLNEEQQEEDPRVQMMITNDFEKATWFQDTHREIEFFLMIKDSDETELFKHYDELVAEIRHAGFQIKQLNNRNFYDYLAYMYENPMINDYYFSRGVFSCLQDVDILEQPNESITYEPEFDYDEYYKEESHDIE